MTQRDAARWASRFMTLTQDLYAVLGHAEFTLAVALRKSGRSPEYAAARIRLRVANRRAA